MCYTCQVCLTVPSNRRCGALSRGEWVVLPRRSCVADHVSNGRGSLRDGDRPRRGVARELAIAKRWRVANHWVGARDDGALERSRTVDWDPHAIVADGWRSYYHRPGHRLIGHSGSSATEQQSATDCSRPGWRRAGRERQARTENDCCDKANGGAAHAPHARGPVEVHPRCAGPGRLAPGKRCRPIGAAEPAIGDSRTDPGAEVE